MLDLQIVDECPCRDISTMNKIPLIGLMVYNGDHIYRICDIVPAHLYMAYQEPFPAKSKGLFMRTLDHIDEKFNFICFS